MNYCPTASTGVRWTLWGIYLVAHVIDQRLPGAKVARLAAEHMFDLHDRAAPTGLFGVAPEADSEQLGMGLRLVQVGVIGHVYLPMRCRGRLGLAIMVAG